MSDTISLEWIGAQLRTIQAEQCTIRAEHEIFRTTVLNTLSEVVRVLSERIGNFETLGEARIDHLGTRIDRLEATRETRFDQVQRKLAENTNQLRLELAEHTARIIVALEGLMPR